MQDLKRNNMVDTGTGILLTPGDHGRQCLGSGDHPGDECCCEECDDYLLCFPDWKPMGEAPFCPEIPGQLPRSR